MQEAEIRSIQMQGNELKQSKAGDRVGIALKGLQSKDLDRGYLISQSETVADTLKLRCRTASIKGEFNVKTDKEVAYSPGDVFLLSKLEDPKQRFLARGTP